MKVLGLGVAAYGIYLMASKVDAMYAHYKAQQKPTASQMSQVHRGAS